MKCVILFNVIVAFVYVYLKSKSTNNVCKTFSDYYSDRDLNENCYHNPDEFLTIPSLVHRYGYVIETHTVTTIDGYILTIFRIPYGRNAHKNETRTPIFIQHGFGSNSASFVNIGPKSLAFILADEGYDIWLGNFRGSSYSKNHITLDSTDSKFWDFSVHELGVLDLPAQIKYVRNITQQKIIYIGHSLGTMAMYIYGVTNPELASDQIDFFINLAPSAYLNKTRMMLRFLFRYWFLVKPIVDVVSGGRLFVRVMPSDILSVVCYPFPIQLTICRIPEMLMVGFNYDQNDPETLPISFKQNADLISNKVLTHFVQFYLSGKFQNYDYGYEGNKRIYGDHEPPFYNLTEMKIPTYFMIAKNDLVTTPENIQDLYEALPSNVRPQNIHVVDNEHFNHVDFVSGKNVVPLVYDHLVKVLKSRYIH